MLNSAIECVRQTPVREYPFLWGLIFFAIALRGGGRYSLDCMFGWEL